VYGKTAVRCNALRHGLSLVSRYNPAHSGEIEQMAKAICSHRSADPALFEQALVIAECNLVLDFVQREKVAMIERFRDPTVTRRDLKGAKLRYRQMYEAYPEFSYLQEKLLAQGEISNRFLVPLKLKPGEIPPKYVPSRDRNESEAMKAAMPDLRRLLRYERRALSRLKRAVALFSAVKLTSRNIRPKGGP
jgi:hypothetical protein